MLFYLALGGICNNSNNIILTQVNFNKVEQLVPFKTGELKTIASCLCYSPLSTIIHCTNQYFDINNGKKY